MNLWRSTSRETFPASPSGFCEKTFKLPPNNTFAVKFCNISPTRPATK